MIKPFWVNSNKNFTIAASHLLSFSLFSPYQQFVVWFSSYISTLVFVFACFNLNKCGHFAVLWQYFFFGLSIGMKLPMPIGRLSGNWVWIWFEFLLALLHCWIWKCCTDPLNTLFIFICTYLFHFPLSGSTHRN